MLVLPTTISRFNQLNSRTFSKAKRPNRSVQFLPAHCSYLQDEFSNPKKQVLWAIQQGYVPILQLTTMHFPNRHWVEPIDKTTNDVLPMDLAIALAKDEIVCYLLQLGANPNRHFLGMSRLYLATTVCSDATVAQMISKVDNVAEPNTSSKIALWLPSTLQILKSIDCKQTATPLHASIYRQSPAITRHLLESNHPVDYPIAINGKTALMLAAQLGKAEWFKLLLTNHANPMRCDRKQRSVLTYAVEGGSIACLNLLEACLSPIAWQDPNLLGLATRHNDPILMQWLVNKNQNFNINWAIRSSIHYKSPQALAWLLDQTSNQLSMQAIEAFRDEAAAECSRIDRRISEFEDLSLSTRTYAIYAVLTNYLKR